jgi:hypothetical protein
MPLISSLPGTARGLLCAPHAWSSAVRRQVGASAERWKNLVHVGRRTIRDRPVSSGLVHARVFCKRGHGPRPVSYYNNRSTPQQSLSS